jgi:hypothetical protein
MPTLPAAALEPVIEVGSPRGELMPPFDLDSPRGDAANQWLQEMWMRRGLLDLDGDIEAAVERLKEHSWFLRRNKARAHAPSHRMPNAALLRQRSIGTEARPLDTDERGTAPASPSKMRNTQQLRPQLSFPVAFSHPSRSAAASPCQKWMTPVSSTPALQLDACQLDGNPSAARRKPNGEGSPVHLTVYDLCPCFNG